MSARFNSRYAWLTVTQIYQSTNDAKDEQLQKEVKKKTPRHDMLIIMWCANAKVGEDNKGWKRAIRSQGIGTKGENVERLAEFCALNDLVIGGTLFKHRGTEMEPTGEKEPRSSQEQLEEDGRRQGEQTGYTWWQLERIAQNRPRWRATIFTELCSTKTKTMRLNCKKSDPITVEGNKLEDVEAFPYLGAMLDKHGGTEADIKRRLAVERNAFATLQPLWKSSKYLSKTKLRIFNTNAVAVLLYGAEAWRTTTADINELDTFQRKCMRTILYVVWPNQISNEGLYHWSNTKPLSVKIKI
ncbi:hypothetical protein ACROYT_G036421 [Oculina patagonica]